MLPAIILTLVALASVGVGVWQAKRIEASAQVLVDQRAPTELATARFNRQVATIGYAAYRTVANEGSSQSALEASQDLDTAFAAGNKFLDKAIAADPSSAGQLKTFRERFKKLHDNARQGADLGLQNIDEAAVMMMGVIDPDITSLTKDTASWIDKHSDATQAMVAKAKADAARGSLISIVFGLVSAGAALLYAMWIGGSKIAKPLNSLSRTMEVLAQGSVEVEVVGAQRKDEVGAMARSVQVFKDNALALRTAEAAQQRLSAETEAERVRNQEAADAAAREQAFVMEHIATGLTRLAEGDLTYRVDIQFPQAYQRLQNDFNGAITQMEEAMRTIVHAANSIGSGSDEIASAADDLSRRSEQQAASLEETAAALDEITATVKRSSAGAVEASRVVTSTRSDAERSAVVVRGAVDAMNQIEKSSQEISQIIGVIDEIAFQTNLLALNAGVEAARAGDAGRGFAVVAQEVRALAQRSADAAKEIKTLISSSTQQVSQGVSMVGQTGEALQAIVSKVSEIDGLVSEIAASGAEQATGLNEVNAAVNQMDQTVQQNAAMVEQSTAASHALKGEANGLMQMIGRFQVAGAQAAVGSTTRRASAPATQVSRPAPRPAVAPATAASRPGANPVKAAQAKLAAFAGGSAQPKSDDWEEF
ncbi:methyl-accepting chemotaxis protein [Caulobacter soli]|uniref:methyl-accepting chemotaxis protein n=1 Tax=Caulobacter soli TaxID=2708539 RepID=UPI0013E9D6CC|nr:methyl-accepting chemotaxis protein [Caulobacter soli]